MQGYYNMLNQIHSPLQYVLFNLYQCSVSDDGKFEPTCIFGLRPVMRSPTLAAKLAARGSNTNRHCLHCRVSIRARTTIYFMRSQSNFACRPANGNDTIPLITWGVYRYLFPCNREFLPMNAMLACRSVTVGLPGLLLRKEAVLLTIALGSLRWDLTQLMKTLTEHEFD